MNQHQGSIVEAQADMQAVLAEMMDLAREYGASAAAVVKAGDIEVSEDLARLCREPRCSNWGLSCSCPPHVPGPAGFREYMQGVEQAVLVKIDLPEHPLHEDERRELGRLMHQMVAAMEHRARERGYGKARAFAGGSCKNIFCSEHANCRVLGEGGECRHPDEARPSLSGFGVNTLKLIKAAGWMEEEGEGEGEKEKEKEKEKKDRPSGGRQVQPRALYGLVLVG